MEVKKTWKDYNGEKHHLVSVIQDNTTTESTDEPLSLIVSKVWSKNKQRWVYKVQESWNYDLLMYNQFKIPTRL